MKIIPVYEDKNTIPRLLWNLLNVHYATRANQSSFFTIERIFWLQFSLNSTYA